LEWKRLYQSIKSRFGWAIALIAFLRWGADLYGEGQVVQEWTSHLPRFLQILSEPWVTPIAIVVGLGLVFWGAWGRGSVSFDNRRWLPKAYQAVEIPHAYIVGLSVIVALFAVSIWSHRHFVLTSPPPPVSNNHTPPGPPSLIMVTMDPLEGDALTTAESIGNFLSGRQALAPPLPTAKSFEQDISGYAYYDRQTVETYSKFYGPHVKELRDDFAHERGLKNNNLENFYLSPQSTIGVRHVADALVQLAQQSQAWRVSHAK
jgi:hypothetical protein